MKKTALAMIAAAGWVLMAPSGAPAQKIGDKLVVHELANGMTFLIYPREGAPVFSAQIGFDVGGSDEPPGQTGIAHMFEHMAFKGTKTVGTKNYKAEKTIMDQIEELEAQAQA
ncbi:insulinase family protein, partial [Candidatus Poribacteria bacterium]|nr:insulinase family protein [Candidatus Poribacteria bacterium]